MQRSAASANQKFSTAMIQLTAVGLLFGGCVNIPERQRSGIEEFETSWTISTNRVTFDAPVPAEPFELEALKETNHTLRLQLVDLLLENRELRGILGVVADSDKPLSVVREVTSQFSDLRQQNEELQQRIASLNAENTQLRQTLVTVQQKANDARRQAEQARNDSPDLEALRTRSAELEQTNKTLASQNEELRRLLVASRQSNTESAPSSREMSQDTAAAEKDAVPMVKGNLRIHALLPNPSGNERMDEAATLVNNGLVAVRMESWRLVDLAGRVWFLDSLESLEPGEKKTIKRHNMTMGLNNGGDTVELLDPQGEAVDRVHYEATHEDEWIVFHEDSEPNVALSQAENP